MRIVLTGGGTAGHITPALALAEELRARGHGVLFAGTPQGVESRLVPQEGIEFTAFEAFGFNRSHPASIVRALRTISRSTGKAKAWLAQVGADAVVCFGGYVCLPVGRAAKALGIPIAVHEQNSVLGMANGYLAKSAEAVCLTYACAGAGLKAKRIEVTGNPVRRSVIDARREEGRAMLGIPQDARMLLAFGGSLGARHLNTALCAMKDELLARPDLYVVHITGPKEIDTVRAALALSPQQESRYIAMGYQDKMGPTLAAADMIISRAGASSLAEISARAIPALLVPFPYATADHQTTNARALVDAGCALLVADADVETDGFRETALRLVDDAALRASMHEAALGQDTAGAAARLADVVCSIAR